MGFYIAVGLIFIFALPCLPASIAKRKGKDFAIWYIYGLFLWIIAVIHAISLPEPPESQKLELKPIQSPTEGGAPATEKVDLDAPLQLLELKLSKGGNDLFFQASFRSLDARKVTALKVRITGYNAFKEPVMLGGSPELEFVLQDLAYKSARVLHMEKPLPYPLP
ncbi:MAG: hypothetical protein LIO46_02005, partial [Clostridiales bacterium]|nr:hypothetical protein [Clostridiales bacterium]